MILNPDPTSLNRHDAMNRKHQKAQSTNTLSHATADFLLTLEAILGSIGTLGQVLLLRRDADR